MHVILLRVKNVINAADEPSRQLARVFNKPPLGDS